MKCSAWFVSAFICMAFANVFGQSDYATIITNVTAGLKTGVNITSLNNTVTTNMGTQNADGSWPDLSYVTGVNGDVPYNTHLTRLYQFSEAYTFPGGTHYGDANLYAKLSLALEYWNANIHDANNWYYDQIGYPQLLGQTLVLMRNGALALSATDSTNAMNYLASRENPSVETGANRIDESLHWLYRGALTANASVVNTAVTQAGTTLNLVSSGSEGINYDYAFLQHGAELMTQTYGNVLLGDVYDMANYINGTAYSFTTAQMQTAFVLLHNSYTGAARGKWKDFSLDGRAISRSGDLGMSASITAQAMKVDAVNYTALRNDSLRLSGVQPASYNIATPYHIHYWTADYTLHNRPTYSFSVRSVSTRTLRDESINGENLLGTFLSEGATDIRVTGNEYLNIFPVWDWNMIPGVTMRDFATTPTNSSGVAGNQAYVGGVSDSTYGASANYMNYNSVTAKKAWFFFDDEVVCVGAGITSTATENVSTCVNQCLLNGSVSVSSGGTISTLATHTQTPYTGNLQWALQGNVGYFFPSGGNVTISNQAQTGSWSTINTTQSTNTITTDVFKMWFDHGVAPTNDTYQYIVVPNIGTTAQMTAYNQSNIKIIVNTVSTQAVKHDGLNMLEAIFRATAGATVTDPTSGLKLTVDQPCAVLVKNIGTSTVTISIADPSQAASSINVGITFPGATAAITKGIVMPAGNYKGSSITFTTNINDVSTPAPSYIAIANGNWASTSTWSSGIVPGTSSNVSIPTGTTVTIAAAVTRDAGTTTTVSGTLILSAVLTANGAVAVNGGTIQVNQAGMGSTTTNSIHFVYDDNAKLIVNNTSAATVGDASVYWGKTYAANEATTTAPRTVIISGTASFGVYGAGTRTVANLLQITSNVPLATTTGSITVTGTFEVSGAITLNASLICNGICQIDAGGSITAGTYAAPTYGSSSILKYNRGTATTVGAEWLTGSANPGYPANVEIANGTVTSAATARSLSKNFTIDAGATFILNGASGNLTMLGNWVNNGTFTPNTSTVSLNGTSAQTLTGATNFYNLILNNTANLTLNNDVVIGNNLTLTNGKIVLGTSNLSVPNPTSLSGASSTKYIVTNGTGTLKIGNIGSTSSDVVFPVGFSTSSYTPLTLNNSGTTDNFSLNVQSPISSVSVNTPNQVVPVLWDLSEDIAGGSNAIITLQWNAADAASATGFSVGSNNVMGHYTGGAWQEQAVSVNGAGPYTAQNSTAYTSFSPFAVGMSGALSGTSLLPLTLTAFSASTEQNKVTLNWQSTNEVAVDDYVIEKGTDGETYAAIGTVTANNKLANSYSFTDITNNNGIAYYRLKMRDKDGSFSYSKTVSVNIETITDVSIFPNPVHNNLYVNYASTAKDGLISIYTNAGKKLRNYTVAKQSTQTVIDVSALASGSYMLIFEGDGITETKRFIKL